MTVGYLQLAGPGNVYHGGVLVVLVHHLSNCNRWQVKHPLLRDQENAAPFFQQVNATRFLRTPLSTATLGEAGAALIAAQRAVLSPHASPRGTSPLSPATCRTSGRGNAAVIIVKGIKTKLVTLSKPSRYSKMVRYLIAPASTSFFRNSCSCVMLCSELVMAFIVVLS